MNRVPADDDERPLNRGSRPRRRSPRCSCAPGWRPPRCPCSPTCPARPTSSSALPRRSANGAAAAGRARRARPPARWISPAGRRPRTGSTWSGIAGEMRPRRDPRPRRGRRLERVGRAGRRHPGLRRRRRRGPGARRRSGPAARLHFVNVSGPRAASPTALLNDARGAINSAFISVASTPVAEAIAPQAAGRQPRRLGRRPRRAAAARRAGPPSTARSAPAVIHHTVNANDYTPEEAPGIVLGHLPLPRQRQRLERHRLQRAGRPLRHASTRGAPAASSARWSAPRRRASTPRRPSIASIGDHTDRGDHRRPRGRRSSATSPGSSASAAPTRRTGRRS